MVELKFYKSESTIKPELLDNSSSSKYSYVRKDVQEVLRPNDGGENILYYEYQEAKLTKHEYTEYLLEMSNAELLQQRADIDFIALLSGVNLEG